MIKLTLFNTLMVELLNAKYLARIVFDSSRFPFSFDLKIGLLYKVLSWFNSCIEVDEKHKKYNRVIDLLCPLLFDVRLYIEMDK